MYASRVLDSFIVWIITCMAHASKASTLNTLNIHQWFFLRVVTLTFFYMSDGQLALMPTWRCWNSYLSQRHFQIVIDLVIVHQHVYLPTSSQTALLHVSSRQTNCIQIDRVVRIEMGWYIDVALYHNTQETDTGIDTIFNVSIYRVSQYIECIDMNMT